MRLLSVLTGRPEPVEAKSGRTGFFKRPRTGAVTIGAGGLAGDHIVDTAHHGGPDQAVYLMGSGDYAHWTRVLDRPLAPGAFGENLLIEGWASAGAATGDRIVIGDCTLELTAPRVPCVTLARVMGDTGFAKRFFAEAHPGAYARVLTTGDVSAGDAVRVDPYRHGPRITMADCLHGTATGFRDPALLANLLRVPAHHVLARMAFDALDKGEA